MNERTTLEKLKSMNQEQKNQFVSKVGQDAYDWLEKWSGCASSSLAGLVNNFDVADIATFKAATGLSGGIAGSCQGACGALSAGVMVIGLFYGRDKLEKTSEFAYQETKRRAGILCDRFTAEFGSMICKDVQFKVYGKAWNLRDKRGQDDFEATKTALGRDKCADVVRKAAELTAEIILEP